MRRRSSRQLLAASLALLVASGCGSSAPGSGGGSNSGTGGGSTPGAIAIALGDAQVGVAGTELARAVVVQVTDGDGRPSAGAQVAFVVTGGGGEITPAASLTGDDGRAEARWRLGPRTTELQKAEARVLDAAGRVLAVAACSATAVPGAVAAIQVESGDGQQGTPGASLPQGIDVVVVDAYGNGVPGVPVRWTVLSGGGAVSPDVAASDGAGRASVAWTLGAAPGAQALRAEADRYSATIGATAVGPAPPPPDGAPTLKVLSPAPGAVARPWLDLVATCSDSAGRPCASIDVTLPHGMGDVAHGTTQLDTRVDLTAYDGMALELWFVARDSAGHGVSERRYVWVEASSHLAVRASVDGGTVWDAQGSRVLFVDLTGSVPTLRIRDIDTGAMQEVSSAPGLSYGWLTPGGATYVTEMEAYPYDSAHDWRGGTTVDLGPLNSGVSLRVAGPYAVYSTQSEVNGPITLVRRDLAAGTSLAISTDAGNVENDVAENGDVAFWTSGATNPALGYNVFRWRAGAITALTSDPGSLWSTYPRTDGSTIVYRRQTAQAYRIAWDAGAGELTLAPERAAEPVPSRDYAVAGGHVAYTREDLAGVLQVWRGGGGADEQVTSFATPAAIDALAPDGTVAVSSGGRRYLAAPGSPPRELGSGLGTVVYRDGGFLVLLGSTVLVPAP